ncbi:MAG: acyl-CoA dehydrogenase family protein [Candidatus Rokuibacteriota bacterium]
MNETRTLLADTVTRILTDLVSKELLESAEQGIWPAGLWQTLEENGLTLPLVPEARGGAGLGWQDAHVILEAAGRHAVPAPLAETIIASWLLAGAGIDVPDGPLTIAPVQLNEQFRLARADRGWRLSGRASRVPWGASAHHIVVAGEVDGKATIALVAGGRARVTADRNVALEPRDTLDFEDTPVEAAAPAASGTPMNAVWLYGALARSAQMAGALQSILAQAVRYATERKQFGRAIGAFQAIQHQLALLAGHTAAAGMAAAHACRAAERGDPTREVAAAKVRVGDAAGFGAGIAHQVHGAIGFTYEHSLHFATRRLWSWRAEFGAEGYWAVALGRLVAERGADQLWPDLTAR